jgi:hypothetical protein
MDAANAFPNGPYHFTINAVHDGLNVITLATPQDDYSAAPQILTSNFDALQNVDSTQPTTVNWNAFSNGTNADFIQLKIVDAGGTTVFSTPRPGDSSALNGDATSVSIPAGTLGTGTSYTGDLFFYKVAVSNTSSYPGVAVAEVFATDTTFPLVTQGQASLQAPTGVVASQGNFPHHVQLTWGVVNGATSYQVFSSTTNDINTATKIAGGLTSTFFNDNTAAPGNLVYYWIRSRNPSNIGPFSTVVSGFIPLPGPGGLIASQGTFPRHVALTWAAVSNSSGYQVFRSTTNDVTTATKITGGLTTTFFNDNTTAHGVTYFYWVRARNPVGVGLFSAAASGFIN